MTHEEQIRDVFTAFGIGVNNIEKTHPNGEYSVETDTVHINTLYTSGFHYQIVEYLEAVELYMHVFVVYADHMAFIIKTWKEVKE